VGANVDKIIDSLAYDQRIGGEYLQAGARYGGPCFPRDNIAFSRLAEEANTHAPLAESSDEVNNSQTEWIADAVRTATPADGTVGILGLSYKPGTYIVTESQGIDLARELEDSRTVRCHDPMVTDQPEAASDIDVIFGDDVEEILAAADTVVLATTWDVYSDIDLYGGTDVTIVDPWAMFTADDLPDAVTYQALGRPDISHSSADVIEKNKAPTRS